jgi:hypothetical protein
MSMRPLPMLRRIVRLATPLALTAGLLTVVTTAGAAAVTCAGLSATHVGTPAADTLVGTAGPDVMVGLGGGDLIKGLGGDDVICGNGGSDDLRGGTGNDRLLGGKGDDFLAGNGGPDDLSGNAGADALWGGSGSDGAVGGSGTDECKAENEAGCEKNPHDLRIERFYVTQSVPSADSADSAAERVPTVRGRQGLFRVFVSANYAKAGVSPETVLHWRTGSGEGEIALSGPATVPVDPDEGLLSKTFTGAFNTGFLKDGMEIYVEVDPDDQYRENSENNNRWPASGWFDLDVSTVPRFDVTFVPIRLNGQTAVVTQQSAEDLLSETLRVHPIASFDVEIHSTYSFNGSTQTDWQNLLYELSNLRSDDGSDRIYYGVLPQSICCGIGGIGFIGFPVSLGIASPHVVAHELGHNLGLSHAPCGGASGTDGDYPYGGGGIGSWGYDIESGVLYDPQAYRDVMSYCSPSWISDYHYNKVLTFRTNIGYAPAYDVPAAGETLLSISGTVEAWDTGSAATATGSSEGLRVTEANTAQAPSSGDYTLVGRDADGKQLFTASFQAYSVADLATTPRYFQATVAVDSDVAASVATIDVLLAGRLLSSRAVAN